MINVLSGLFMAILVGTLLVLARFEMFKED